MLECSWESDDLIGHRFKSRSLIIPLTVDVSSLAGSKSSLVETEQGQEGDSTKDVDRVLDASQSGGVSGQTSASGNSERPNPGSSDGSKSHESGQAGSSAQLSSSPQESSVQKSSEPTKKAEEPARGEGGWKKLARRKEEVSTGGGKPGNEEETRRMVGDVLGGFSGPASDFGRGLSREALQSLRQRKIDKEGTAQSKVERSGESVFERGTGATARRYNAGF